jgi:hypothetical protein
MPALAERNQVGKREDLADKISIVDARATPFASMVKKGKKPGNTLMEWQVDAYDDTRLDGVIDGTDVEEFENAGENRAMLRNYIQLFRRTAKVTNLAEDVSNVAGASEGEMARSIAKKLVEIKRDQEAAFLSDNNSQADTGGVPYITRGLGKWIVATDSDVNPVPAAYLPASAQIITTATASLDEDTDIQGMLKAIFDNTGLQGNYKLICGSTLRRRFTDMTRTDGGSETAKIRTFQGSIDSKEITNSTAIFNGDFGSIEVIPSQFIGRSKTSNTTDIDRGYVLDMDKIVARYTSLPSVKKLEDRGGGPRALIDMGLGLIVQNPKGLGKFQP